MHDFIPKPTSTGITLEKDVLLRNLSTVQNNVHINQYQKGKCLHLSSSRRPRQDEQLPTRLEYPNKGTFCKERSSNQAS